MILMFWEEAAWMSQRGKKFHHLLFSKCRVWFSELEEIASLLLTAGNGDDIWPERAELSHDISSDTLLNSFLT